MKFDNIKSFISDHVPASSLFKTRLNRLCRFGFSFGSILGHIGYEVDKPQLLVYSPFLKDSFTMDPPDASYLDESSEVMSFLRQLRKAHEDLGMASDWMCMFFLSQEGHQTTVEVQTEDNAYTKALDEVGLAAFWKHIALPGEPEPKEMVLWITPKDPKSEALVTPYRFKTFDVTKVVEDRQRLLEAGRCITMAQLGNYLLFEA